MTREEILAMDPGRELDDAVRLSLGWTKYNLRDDGTFACWATPEGEQWNYLTKGLLPKHSTDISAAWEVVEGLNGKYGFFIQRLGDYFDEGKDWKGWEASFGGQSDRLIRAKTAPEAICKASLLAVMDL